MFNLKSFFPSFGSPYRFNPISKSQDLGLGVEGLGFDRPQGLQAVSLSSTGIDRLVSGSFAPLTGGKVFAPQKVTDVALTGNGANLSGQLALQALANLQKPQD